MARLSVESGASCSVCGMTTLTPNQELDLRHLDFDADAERMHRRRWKTLGVLCLSLVLICIDNTILNVAIPTLAREFHATASQLQWIVDSYILVFAGLLLTAGFVGDKFGRRGALMSGMVIFGIGSIAASMAGSASQLIACRALMGVGGALIMPATLSILTNVFRDPKERAKAIAIWAGCSGLGVALGPGHRRLVDRALLVGLGVPGEPTCPAARPRRQRARRAAVS